MQGERYVVLARLALREMLRQLGKITKAEIEAAEVNDVPPRYRLACQCFVRNEDILVKFDGDQTLPAQGPHITHAAKRSAKVEEDAAIHFDELAAMMENC